MTIEENLKQIEGWATEIIVATRTTGSDYGVPYAADKALDIVMTLAALREQIAEMERLRDKFEGALICSNAACRRRDEKITTLEKERQRLREQLHVAESIIDQQVEQIATLTAERDAAVNHIDDMLRSTGRNATNILDPCLAIRHTYRELVSARKRIATLEAAAKERDARTKKLEEALRYAVTNLEGVRDVADTPSIGVIRFARAALSPAPTPSTEPQESAVLGFTVPDRKS